MARYNIYAGLGGGFGGANYIETAEFASEEDAMSAAEATAREVYESYSGLHGLFDADEYMEEQYPDFDALDVSEQNDIEVEMDALREEDFQAWAVFYVLEADDANSD